MSNNKVSPALQDLLANIRQHPGFSDLLKIMDPPEIPRFKRSQAADVEKARADWIYQSGRRDQFDQTVVLLSGQQIPPKAE